jgi:capsular polysaccharide biosynthesis protein
VTTYSEIEGSEYESTEAEPPLAFLVGRLVSLRFVIASLRARRILLICLALGGLIIGAGYHFVVPRQYEATTTLYLAHAPGTDDDVDMSNDLALLQTRAVAERAIARLDEPALNPTKLLGKAPGTVLSDDVLSISIGGPSKAEAIRRANAVAAAFLAFRNQSATQEADASTSVQQKQLNLLQTQVSALTAQINSGSTTGSSRNNLTADESADTNEMVTLEQNIHQADTNVVAVANGSYVLTPGLSATSSRVKVLILDAFSGLVGGLAVGIGFVALQALLSDRVRRRDDVATLLGAPVELSISVRPPRVNARRWTKKMVRKPSPDVVALASFFRSQRDVAKGRSTLLVMAADKVETPVAALGVLASRLAAEGRSVAIVDLTEGQLLATVIEAIRKRATELVVDDPVGEVTLVRSPPNDARAEDRPDPLELDADVMLALATVHAKYGAWHLSWAREAIVTISAGHPSAQHVSAVAELARGAGVFIAGAALLEADANDETLGHFMPGDANIARLTEALYSATAGLDTSPTPTPWSPTHA